MVNKKIILICTPIKSIKNLYDKFNKYFRIIYKPNIELNRINNLDKISYIFTNPNMSKIKFTKKNLIKIKNLKIICTASTGTNHIDLDFLRKKKIKLISLRKKKNVIKKISSTSELALTFALNAIRNINIASNSVLEKKWEYLPFVGRQLNSITIGIIGYGRLGKILVNLLKSLKCKVLIYEKNFKLKDKNKKFQTGLDFLLKNSDVISLHIHADKKNIKFINSKNLKIMKKNVILINTSRGEIVSENDLVNFLRKNKNAKYFTDVINDEINNKWKSLIFKEFLKKKGNVVITPHIGGMTLEAQQIAFNAAADHLINLHKKMT